MHMTESSDALDTPAKPQDYAGLRTALSTLVNDFTPLINELWPRLDGHKDRERRDGYPALIGRRAFLNSPVLALQLVSWDPGPVPDSPLRQAIHCWASR
jgi:hypothetical protein